MEPIFAIAFAGPQNTTPELPPFVNCPGVHAARVGAAAAAAAIPAAAASAATTTSVPVRIIEA